MSPSLQTRTVQDDWSVGEVYDVAPQLISPAGAASMGNVLLDEDGSPYRRGGTAYKSKEGLGTAGLRWGWDGFLLPGPRTVFASESSFGVLASDDESVVDLGGSGLSFPKQSAALEDLLYIGGGTLYGGSRKGSAYSTGTISVTKGSKVVNGSGTSWTANVDPGMLLHVDTGRVYVVAAVASDTQLTLRDAYQGPTGGGISYTLNPLWAISGADPYEISDYVATCANRLVLASGRRILFTEVNNPHSITNSLGTTNEHTVPEGVEVTGLASVGQTLLIFTTGGIWTLDGLALSITDLNGNPQHRLQQLSSEIILAGAAGIAGSGQRLVVPAGDGIYLMDGISQPTKISKPIDRAYLQRIADGYRIGGAKVYRGHYFLPLLNGLGKVKELRVCRIDRPIRDRGQTVFPWVHFTGDGGQVPSYFIRATVDPQEPKLFGAQGREPSRVVDCSGYFSPSAVIKDDADGSPVVEEIITRDFETGNGTVNAVRSLKIRHELISAGGSPRLHIAYSDGSTKSTGTKWGTFQWGKAPWGGSGAAWVSIGEIGPSDGRDLGRLRVNKRARYIRFRIRGVEGAGLSVLRVLELKPRPSRADRR